MTDVTFRAKWLLPISKPAIENGWVRMVDGQVAELGRGQPPGNDGIDLGDVAVMPALVNAHTHLEFSSLRAPIGRPGMSLCDWIVAVVESRQQETVDPQVALRRGLDEIQASGCSVVADIATTPIAYPSRTSFKGYLFSFAEVLGLSEVRASHKQNLALEHFLARESAPRFMAGISPHAPYSTPYELVTWCVRQAADRLIPLAMHVAESDEERQLIERGQGPFLGQLVRIVPTAHERFPWDRNATMQLLQRLSEAPRSLLIHGNYLRDTEMELIAKQPQMTVVYCPRTHHYFGHPRHPVDKLLSAGVRVALGTDSLASNPDLSVWNEVQWLVNHRQDLCPQNVLEMATMAGADALGATQHGRLAPGSDGQLLQLPLAGLSVEEAMAKHSPLWITGSIPERECCG